MKLIFLGSQLPSAKYRGSGGGSFENLKLWYLICVWWLIHHLLLACLDNISWVPTLREAVAADWWRKAEVSSCRIMMWWSLQGVHSLFSLFTLPSLPLPPRAISRCVFIKKRHVLTHPSFRLYVIVQIYYFRLFTVWVEDSSRATDGKFVWGNNFKK